MYDAEEESSLDNPLPMAKKAKSLSLNRPKVTNVSEIHRELSTFLKFFDFFSVQTIFCIDAFFYIQYEMPTTCGSAAACNPKRKVR